ncbi:MAG: hydantoinase/oxoprolinase N-terminal domain-containing protein, partial [Butyricicoccus sp.]|nr:hydantoinase/oxoprolinase N-terminal domain-containing protein [Butyricicoccus sp.]
MKLAIGIDTGGTCTDAVLYDFESGRVLGRSKALTTYDDLTRGILAALDGLDPDLCRQAAVAGLSTTLATNACVEGKFRRTRLLLMGIDRRGIERFGADYGFTDPDDIRYLPCRTTITGQVLEEPDWDFLRAHAADWFSDVEGCAVCEIYGMRNGGVLERKAASILGAATGLPVVCASTLFGGLSSLERAASAVLNAGLLPVTRDF